MSGNQIRHSSVIWFRISARFIIQPISVDWQLLLPTNGHQPSAALWSPWLLPTADAESIGFPLSCCCGRSQNGICGWHLGTFSWTILCGHPSSCYEDVSGESGGRQWWWKGSCCSVSHAPCIKVNNASACSNHSSVESMWVHVYVAEHLLLGWHEGQI